MVFWETKPELCFLFFSSQSKIAPNSVDSTAGLPAEVETEIEFFIISQATSFGLGDACHFLHSLWKKSLNH